ncbi:SPOR domain-containing protein [Vibrio sp. FNV 38]|nr:SPOR domain-containing protein [Vibrio sp. FNV 38]
MKKMLLISLTSLLAACASDSYITDVKSESFKEDYTVSKEVAIVEVEAKQATGKSNEQMVEMSPAKSEQQKKPVVISSPSKEQLAVNPRYGFTIQVAAVGTQAKVDEFARQLPSAQQPVWENYKVVNGTKWYTVLYGDYATRKDAVQAITQLPNNVRTLKPFVKSIDEIKNSAYPTLNKLN